MTLLTSKGIFWVNLWNSFEFEERAVMWAFGVTKFESVLKKIVSPFLVALGPILARNFCITPERGVVRTRRRLHLVSCRILRMDAAHFRKF